ncbi:type II secretion system protein [Candidatus Daviesbacteria bacterium]|nr:type II secretion system protein [Candidatus Daviesbacteria bacterium]
MKKFLPKLFKGTSGFTLIELLVALTIVTILAVAVYVALNPAQRLKDSKDARRTADIESILTAIHQSIVDNKGTYPTNMPADGTVRQIGTGNATDCPVSVGTDCNTTDITGYATVCADLMAGGQNLSNYLASIPLDPLGGSTANAVKTGYAVGKTSVGIVTVYACHTDGTSVIKVSR